MVDALATLQTCWAKKGHLINDPTRVGTDGAHLSPTADGPTSSLDEPTVVFSI